MSSQKSGKCDRQNTIIRKIESEGEKDSFYCRHEPVCSKLIYQYIPKETQNYSQSKPNILEKFTKIVRIFFFVCLFFCDKTTISNSKVEAMLQEGGFYFCKIHKQKTKNDPTFFVVAKFWFVLFPFVFLKKKVFKL